MQARLRSTQGLRLWVRGAYPELMRAFEKTIPLGNEAATRKLGADLAARLRPGDVVLLRGGLGAGKTSLARGLIETLSDTNEVPSPTYTLVQMYPTPDFEIWHFDLYRLEAPGDLWELGIEDALEEGVCLIEWPERIESMLTGAELRIDIDFEEQGRSAKLSGDKEWEARLAGL